MPTLGYTSIGGSNGFWATGTIGTDGQDYQLAVSGTVTAIKMYCNAWDGNNPTNLSCAIYDDSGNKVATSDTTSINNTAEWKTLNINVHLNSGTNYRLAFQSEGWIIRYYDAGTGTNFSKTDTQTWLTWPDPITWDDLAAKDQFSLYAEYTNDTTTSTSTTTTSSSTSTSTTTSTSSSTTTTSSSTSSSTSTTTTSSSTSTTTTSTSTTTTSSSTSSSTSTTTTLINSKLKMYVREENSAILIEY